MSRRPVDLDELYFQWLYSQVCSIRTRNRTRTYWTLMRQLFEKPFVWIVPNDDNRAEDGKDLRYQFLDDAEIHVADPLWLRRPCSMLEMLIAISRRLAFSAGGDSRDWFWHLIENLEIDNYNDSTPIHKDEIDEVLDRVIWRMYDKNGRGGLFPLRRSRRDQRRVELWYQMSEYTRELDAG